MAEPSPLTAPTRRHLIIGFALGALLRILLLPLSGSPDVGSWKVWSFAGAVDPTTMYGVGGTPPERRVMHWRGNAITTDYPPLGLYELAMVGRVYSAIDPSFDDTATLTALVKTPGVLFEIGLVAVVLLWIGPRTNRAAARWTALAIWMNPAIILNGSALGYLDAEMAVPAALALVAGGSGFPFAAGVLLAAGILTKAQALFLAPVVIVAVLAADHERALRLRALAMFACGAILAAALIVGPIVVRGAWPNMVLALSRLATHDMVSGEALNVWWIVTWIVRALVAVPDLGWWGAFTLPVKILGITRFMEVGYPNPRPVGIAICGTAIAWALWRSRHGRSLAGWTLVGAWCVYAYSMFAAQVHENHGYLVVPLLAIAAGLETRYRRLFWAVSGIVAFNLYIFYGLGPGWPPLLDRRWTGVDMTVIVAAANVIVFAMMTRHVAGGGERDALRSRD